MPSRRCGQARASRKVPKADEPNGSSLGPRAFCNGPIVMNYRAPQLISDFELIRRRGTTDILMSILMLAAFNGSHRER